MNQSSASSMFKEMIEATSTGISEGMLGGDLSKVDSKLFKPKPLREELSRIAQLILAIDAAAVALTDSGKPESELRESGRKRLAAQLGCRIEDLLEIVGSYGEEKWESMVLEERVRRGIDSSYMKDATWDRLEGVVLRKLLLMVESDKVSGATDLLAIAKAANTAVRKGRIPGGVAPNMNKDGGGNETNISIGFHPGNPADGVLPAGDLGTIQLKLSHRVRKQIDGTAERESVDNVSPSSSGLEFGDIVENKTATTPGRFLDSVEMLSLESVQDVIKEQENE